MVSEGSFPRRWLGGALLVLFVSCFAPAPARAPAGLSAERASAPSRPSKPTIAIGRIESAIPSGTWIGGEVDPFGAPTGVRFLAPDGLSPSQSGSFSESLAELLREKGYRLLPRSEAFGMDESASSELVLLAVLSWVKIHRWAFPQGRTEVGLAVDWELLTRQKGRILHRATTAGESALAQDPWSAQLLAFRQAAERFLSQEASVRILSGEGLPVPVQAGRQALEPMRLPSPSALPPPATPQEMIQRALPAVFALRTQNGHGTGFFIRGDGLALTSAHVVAGRISWDASLADGRMVRMQVVREAAECDLALLQASEGDFSFLPLGESRSLRPGQEVYVIGTPVYLGLSQSVSRGIVSALRTEPWRTLIQTDAAVNAGSSGGPVLDAQGRVVGIVDLKLAARNVEGIGFCTAVDDARSALRLVFP